MKTANQTSPFIKKNKKPATPMRRSQAFQSFFTMLKKNKPVRNEMQPCLNEALLHLFVRRASAVGQGPFRLRRFLMKQIK